VAVGGGASVVLRKNISQPEYCPVLSTYVCTYPTAREVSNLCKTTRAERSHTTDHHGAANATRHEEKTKEKMFSFPIDASSNLQSITSHLILE
jgi:hypothetical protein